MKKVTIVNFQHCEDDGPCILAVIEGTSKVKAKNAAVANRQDDECPCRIVDGGFGDLVLEERFLDNDYPDGFTPWMESGTIYLTVHNVQ